MTPPDLPTADPVVLDYLDRLRDVLPARRARGVVDEVAALVADRLEPEGGASASPEAVRRALAALGSPEALATSLVGGATTIDLATRRAFGRMLAVLFAGHLLVAIVLTVIGRDATLVPGLVVALPREGWIPCLLGVASVFFVDAGCLGVLFALYGRAHSPELLQRLRLRTTVRRRDAVGTLVLLALLATLLHVGSFRDALFSVGGNAGRLPILAPEALELLPAASAVLALFATKQVLHLLDGRERPVSVACDALASLAGAAFCVLLITRAQLLRIPAEAGLSDAQARLFSDLILRVVLVVGLVAALLLAARFVKRVLRLRQLLAG